MKHGGGNALDWPITGVQYFCVAVIGAGAAAPVAPVDGRVAPNFPIRANALSRVAAEIPTRAGVGDYVVTIDANFQTVAILDAPVSIYGTVGKWGQVSAINAATRQLTLKVFAAAGAAADLAATDLVVINVKAIDSTQI